MMLEVKSEPRSGLGTDPGGWGVIIFELESGCAGMRGMREGTAERLEKFGLRKEGASKQECIAD